MAYIRLWRQSLIGLGAYRSHRGYKGVAVPAADWLRSLQELRWIFSPRSESTEITLVKCCGSASHVILVHHEMWLVIRLRAD